jgi:O-antigen ligase
MILFYGLFLAFTAAAAFTGQYILAATPFVLLLFYAGWQYRNYLFFLLLFTIPFSFEHNFSSGLGTDIPDELLMLLVSVIFFAYRVYSPAILSKKVITHPLLLLLGVLLCWTVLTVVFSTDPQVSVKYILAKTWYLGAFVLAPLVLFRKKRNLLIAASVLAGSMLLVTVIILFRHAGMGFSFASINKAVSPFFRNHVNYSAMLVCMLPVMVGFFIWTDQKNIRRGLGLAILVVLVALFFSYARGAWLVLPAGLIAYWMIRKKLLFYSYLLGILVTAGSVFWLQSNDRYLRYATDYNTTIFHSDFSSHLVSTYRLKDLSTAERFYRWIAGVRMIKENALTGYGPNTFYEHYKEYAIPAYKTWVSDNPDHSTVHNYFLLTAIEQGIPGLIFLLVLLGAMLYYAQYLYYRVTDRVYKTVAAVSGVMIIMIIGLNFFSDLIETDKIGSLFFLCLTTLVVVDMNSREPSSCEGLG